MPSARPRLRANHRLIARLQVNPLIATLGVGLVLQGLLSASFTNFAGSVPPEFQALAYGAVARALYHETQTLCEAAGLPAYEISNHARPGAACRHNLIYWRYQDYVGVGPGAHGRFGRANGQRFGFDSLAESNLLLGG